MRPVLVRDVAEVRIGEALRRGEGSHNAQPAVILGIQKQPGANTLELTRTLDTTLDEIQKTLPNGMSIDRHIFRQADFIERALTNLEAALRDGGILVVIVVLLFLWNVRAAAITLVAIPLSMVAAVLLMDYFGYTINTMSLGGLASSCLNFIQTVESVLAETGEDIKHYNRQEKQRFRSGAGSRRNKT
jgi:Cu/Ag efflux pump CusA